MKKVRKLVLSKETVKRLAEPRLLEAVGATIYCGSYECSGAGCGDTNFCSHPDFTHCLAC